MPHILCIGTHDIREARYGAERSVHGSVHAIVAEGARLTYAMPSSTCFDEQDGALRVCGMGGAPQEGFRTMWRSIRLGIPYKFAKYYLAGFIESILGLAQKSHFDALLIHGAHMGMVGLAVKRALRMPAALRTHNIEYQIVEEYSAQLGMALKPLANWQARLTRKTERSLWHEYDKVLFIGDNDTRIACANYQDLCPETINAQTTKHLLCVYDGVDHVDDQPSPHNEERFVISGAMNVIQNRVSVRWFICKVWPKVFARYPDIRLDVIGVDTKQLLSCLKITENYLARFGINVLGKVPSFVDAVAAKPYFISPTIMGSGYRVKLAEAGSTGRCLFVSDKDAISMAFLQHGRNCLRFSDASSFCESYALVRQDSEKRKTLGSDLKTALRKHMSWEKHGRSILNILGQA